MKIDYNNILRPLIEKEENLLLKFESEKNTSMTVRFSRHEINGGDKKTT